MEKMWDRPTGNCTAVVSLLTTSMECRDMPILTITEKYSAIRDVSKKKTLHLVKIASDSGCDE